VNPCGFAMLPAYLSFFLGTGDDDRSSSKPPLRVAGIMTVAFLFVFGTAGLLLSAGLQLVVTALPWLALLVGVAMVGLGVHVFRGGALTVATGGRGRVNRKSIFWFGASYAVASLSCTLPIFLSLIVGSIATTSPLEAAVLFLVYGAGMSLVIASITLGLAAGQDRIVRLVRGASRWMAPISGTALSAAGLFIIWYWATVLTLGAVALGESRLVQFVDQVSSALTDFARRNVVLAAGGLAALAAASWLMLRFSRHRANGPVADGRVEADV
jgi:cytochrome c-type biogenesis protein